MDREPVKTIGAVMASVKLAVVATVGVLVIALELPDRMGEAVILAAGLIIAAVGDVLTWRLQRERVTPVAAPRLPLGSSVTLADGTEGRVGRA